MNIVIISIVLVIMIASIFVLSKFALWEETPKVIIKGVVNEIAKDKSYIIVSGRKISIKEDFWEIVHLEPGDEVKVLAQKENGEWLAVDCEHLLTESEKEAIDKNEIYVE